MTNKGRKTERLYPIRIDRPLKDELERISQEMGLKKSEVIRVGIQLFIEKNSVSSAMETLKRKTDAWYKKEEKK